MSLIDRIAISHHRLPLEPPFPAAWDRRPRTGFPVTVYRVFDGEGRQGVAAGDAMRGLIDYIDLLIGLDPEQSDQVSAILDNIGFFDGRPWPLELAVWDLKGKIRGQPVWRMLGGDGQPVPVYASSGSLWAVEEVPDRVDRLVDAGFGALKLRMGRPTVEEDLEVVRMVGERVGDRMEVMVDCNQGWRMPWDTHPSWSLDTALDVARELEAMGVWWMEEPLHRGDVEGMRRMRESVGVRIAGGEMTRQLHELDTLLRAGALDVYQPDAAVTCGIHQLSGFARRVHEAGAVFSPHTWGSGVALVANAHLVAGTAGTPWLEYPFDPPVWTADRRDYVLRLPWEPRDGRLHLSERPGLGIELDEARLAATRVDSIAY